MGLPGLEGLPGAKVNVKIQSFHDDRLLNSENSTFQSINVIINNLHNYLMNFPSLKKKKS